MLIKDVVCILFLLAGFFFFLTATLGLLRLPDFYARLHATGKGDTLAVFLALIGLAVYEGFSLTSVKIVLIAVFMFLAQLDADIQGQPKGADEAGKRIMALDE